MRKSELTESHVQGPDLDIQTQSTDVTTSIKKDIIGTNLVRNRYLPSWRSSSPSLYSSLDSSKVAESMPGPKPSSFIMPNLGSTHIVIRILHMTKVEVIKEDVTTIKKRLQNSESNASEDVTNLAFRVQRMEGFIEQIAIHMGLSNHVLLDAQPGSGCKPQRPGPTLGPNQQPIFQSKCNYFLFWVDRLQANGNCNSKYERHYGLH